MKKLLLLLFISLQSFAQSYSIKGTLVDTSNAPLEFATLFLLNPSDSTMLSFTRSDVNGKFEFKGVKKSDVVLQATFVGYLPLKRAVKYNPAELNLDLGSVQLKPIDRELYEVVVKTAKAPMAFKGDTVEYDASKFKVPPGATVEDLLKRLPGFQVDNDGNIKAQGENITKVLVGGKRFFGSDPKAATKNLPSEAISKVQVFNDVSEQSKLTGVADGSQEKTLNLELKDEFKKGAFGKLTAGVGTDDRLLAKGNYNRFDDKNQLSIIGFGNNINQSGLSNDDYQDFRGSQSYNWGDNVDFGFNTGGGRVIYFDDSQDGVGIPQSWGPDRGFSKNFAGGVNYNYDTKKTKVSSNYFYNKSTQTLEEVFKRQVVLPQTNYDINGSSFDRNATGNHRGSVRYEQEIDSLRSLTLFANGRIADRNQLSDASQLYLNKTGETFRSQNPYSKGTGKTYNIESSVIFRNKFKKAGRTFLASGTYILNNVDNDARQTSNVEEYQVTGENFPINSSLNINQNAFGFSDTRVLKASALYAEPLSKKLTWESFANISNTFYQVNRSVFALGDGPQSNRVDSLSRYMENTVNYQRIGTSIKYTHKGLFGMIGVAAQKVSIDGDLFNDKGGLLDSAYNRNFPAILPIVTFRYKLSNTSYLNLSGSMDETPPSLRNLQPYIDNSNPMNLVAGNLNLGTAKSQGLNLSYSTFNPVSFFGFNTYFNYRNYRDRIVYNRVIDEYLVSYSSPENIKDGGNSLSGNVGVNFPIIKTKVSVDLWTNASFSKIPMYINSLLNQSESNNYGVYMNMSVTPVSWLSWFIGANFSSNETKYSILSSQNQTYQRYGLSSDLNIQMPKKVFFGTTFAYSYEENKRLNFELHRPILGFKVYKIFGKGDKHEVRFAGNDLFNRNLGISQSISQNVASSSTTSTLSRYFMLSYTFNIRGNKSQLKKNQWD